MGAWQTTSPRKFKSENEGGRSIDTTEKACPHWCNIFSFPPPECGRTRIVSVCMPFSFSSVLNVSSSVSSSFTHCTFPASITLSFSFSFFATCTAAFGGKSNEGYRRAEPAVDGSVFRAGVTCKIPAEVEILRQSPSTHRWTPAAMHWDEVVAELGPRKQRSASG